MRKSAVLVCAVAAGFVLGAVAGCSTQDCKDMKGKGSFFGDLVCGGQGTDAPEPEPVKPSACSNLRLVMPGFFKLLDDPTRPLDKLREAVKALGTPTCLRQPRACAASDECAVGDCKDGFCPCTEWYSPLADILQITFRGLAAVASDKIEPGAVGGRCLSPAAAQSLPPESINRMCEVRRMLDVLVGQDAGKKILEDPAVLRVTLRLLHYVQGAGEGSDGRPHYDLFTTLGRMAQNPGVCAPSDLYDFLDRTLAYFTPQKAAQELGAIESLLADQRTKDFLKGLATGNDPKGRQSVITIIKTLAGNLTAAPSGAEAWKKVEDLLKQLIYPYLENNFPPDYVAKVKTTVEGPTGTGGIKALFGDAAGIFPYLQKLLRCASNPVIENNGELIGAIYDLVSLSETATTGVDLATLVGALKALTTVDSTGQVGRSLRLVLRAARDDDDATEAVRALLAQVLTPEIAQKLLPPIDTLVQNKVLGEVLTLLDDLLYSCKPPKP